MTSTDATLTKSLATSAAPRSSRVPPHVFFAVSAVFHYLGPAFAVLLFARVDVLGVAWLRIASAAVIFAAWRRPWRRCAGRSCAAAGSSSRATTWCAGTRLFDAIVVGSRTVVEDDPALTVRDPGFSNARPPVRVVVDSAGRLPPVGHLFDGVAPTLIATTERAPEIRVAEWQTAGAEVIVLDRDADGGVSLEALLDALGKRDVQGVVVEGGANLAWAFLRDGLVDRVVLYVAPKVIGGAAALGVVAGKGFAPVDRAASLVFERVERIGPDLKVEARVENGVHRDR